MSGCMQAHTRGHNSLGEPAGLDWTGLELIKSDLPVNAMVTGYGHVTIKEVGRFLTIF